MPRTLPGLLLLVTLAASQAVAQSPGAVVDSLLSPYATTDGPGAVVTVVQDGEVLFMRGYGMASLEQGTAIMPATIFDIGSVAKQFTGFALALLEGEGVLDLDDDIRTYLPEVPDFGNTITIRHLLNHTSGLREIYDAKALAGWQGGDGIEQREALKVTAAMRELNFESGTEYLYCNTAYMLLADIVARVSGVPFPEWMEANVFGPLGMENTEIMDSLGEVIPDAADSYRPMEDGGFQRVFDNSSGFGQGGIYTNAPDMAKWLSNFGSMELGGAAAQERLRTRGILSNGDTLRYALGISVTSFRGQPLLTHGGASAGFRSGLAFFPEINAGVFVQSNRADFPGTLMRQIGAVFFQDAFEAEAEPEPGSSNTEATPPEFVPENLSQFEGRYFSEEIETVYTVRLHGTGLELVHRRRETAALDPRAEDVFRASGWTLAFQRDDGGSVTGFRVTTGRVRNLLFQRMD